MRISDWSSDVCSSDLIRRQGRIRALSTVALRKQDTLRAGELMGVASVALPESIRLANAQQKTVERVAQLKQDMEATKELHRLSALQGKLLDADGRSEVHTSELPSLMRISYAVFCLKKKQHTTRARSIN